MAEELDMSMSHESSWEQLTDRLSFPDTYQAISSLDKKIKLDLALAVLEGECFNRDGGNEEKENYFYLFHHWLRWVLSDDPSTNTWWHWVAETKKETIGERDEYTLKLWNSMDSGNNIYAKMQVEKKLTSWSYYQNFFFNWFLTRSNIVNARAVFRDKFFTRFFHIPLATWVILCVTWFFHFSAQTRSDWLWSISAVLFGFSISCLFSSISVDYFLQSLIPRLAVTTGIGYLFLISVPDLLKLLYRSSHLLPITWEMGLTVMLILAVFFYMNQVLQRRVRPHLSFLRTYARSGHLLIVGVAYSAVGLLLVAPIIFTPLLLGDSFITENTPMTPMYLLITAAIALAIGTVLQLVWDDKPVTEPL